MRHDCFDCKYATIVYAGNEWLEVCCAVENKQRSIPLDCDKWEEKEEDEESDGTNHL